VVQLHRQIDAIQETGAVVHVIGNGSPSFMAGFREETGWTGPLFTDPSLEVFKAAELHRGVGSTIDPRGWFNATKAMKYGQRQGRIQGDTWQQGGVLIVTPSGDVKWHCASKRAGDVADASEIIAALR
jgi:hypothetical protein